MNSSGTALQGASVFAQNTTLGTVTDEEGNFRLGLSAGSHDLVVTFTGMQAESKRVSAANANQEHVFVLSEKEKQMDEVAVVASNEVKDGWEKYGAFFLSEFIGESPNARQTTITNPEVLKFFYSKRRNRLKVLADEDIKIENPALGYNIRYNLDSFTHEYTTKMSMFAGYPLFEERPAADSAQAALWSNARLKAYDGSILHLMRSIYDGSVKEEGFAIQGVAKRNNRDVAVDVPDQYTFINYLKDDSLQTVTITPQQSKIGVQFSPERPLQEYNKKFPSEPKDRQFSIMVFQPGHSLVIEPSGYYFEQGDVTYGGYLAWVKIGDLLPYNYSLPGEDPQQAPVPITSTLHVPPATGDSAASSPTPPSSEKTSVKYCPTGGEVVKPEWKFCPVHGVKLEL